MTSPVVYTGENTITLTYKLTLPDGAQLTGQTQATSAGKGPAAHPYYKRQPDNDGGWRHADDPDARVCDWLAEVIWEHYRFDDVAYANAVGAIVGTIDIADAQGPCRSCRSVMAQLKKEYQNVAITVVYPAYDNNPTSPGLGGGVYGYSDARLEGGLWKKTL